jgi:ribosomal protein L29
MTFPKYKDLETLKSISDINNEILRQQKILFTLRTTLSTSNGLKTHMFLHLKRKIAQLKFKKATIKEI